MTPAERKSLRIDRGWKLRDVSVALGVTEATLSRWERGLQTPPERMQRAWEQLLTGVSFQTHSDLPRRRRPRGVLPRLAELFLTDVKAGVNGYEAGWRDLAELGVADDDIPALESEIERRSAGQIRIGFNSRLEAVQQAKEILGYRRTLREEETTLLPALENGVRPLLYAVRSTGARNEILLAGLTEMVSAAAEQVAAARTWLDDAAAMLDVPQGAASVILEAVGIPVISDTIAFANPEFDDIASCAGSPEAMARAHSVGIEIGLHRIAKRLGVDPVTALGAAWAVHRRLTRGGIGVLTEEGSRYLSDVFWDGLGLSRVDIDAVWRKVMIDDLECNSEKEQLGMLTWSWPEAL